MAETTKQKNVLAKLAGLISGDLEQTESARQKYSHDTSLFELEPEAVVFPKNSQDVSKLVEFASANKKEYPNLSLTARSGGTDMSGGAINDSIIVAFERYITRILDVDSKEKTATVQPGVYFRDFDEATRAKSLLLPSYPASREICMLGGMVANDSGGEKSLKYGKTHDYVASLKIILRDGQEYELKPLAGQSLKNKLAGRGLDSEIYREIHQLVTQNEKLIKDNKPQVSKNSIGYNLWDAWDGKTLDLTKLVVGSQGTLGLVTETKLRLVAAKPFSGMMVLFLPSMKGLGELINNLLELKPTSMESFDKHTLTFALRFFLGFRKTLGWKRFILLSLSFIPLMDKLLHYLPRLPEIIMLVEFEGDSQAEVDAKLRQTASRLKDFDVETQVAEDKKHEEKFWLMRRESFNILRKNVHKRHTAPFIDDLVVPPGHLPEFLPKLVGIMEKYDFLYTIAGHMGDGNFHIIPLMDLSDKRERAKIKPALLEVIGLVKEYGGSLSGEHNEGLIRGPFLDAIYPPEMVGLFKRVKQIFDPDNIFNPHKKTDATWKFSQAHIRRRFES